jgi:hypothetical protein
MAGEWLRRFRELSGSGSTWEDYSDSSDSLDSSTTNGATADCTTNEVAIEANEANGRKSPGREQRSNARSQSINLWDIWAEPAPVMCFCCGGEITDPLTHFWGGDPVHPACGEAAFRAAKQHSQSARG